MFRLIASCLSRFTRFICVFILTLLSATAGVQAQTVFLFVDGDDGLATPIGNPPGQSWSDGYKYLRDAIDQADDLLSGQDPPDNVEIWVAAAEEPYRPDRDADHPDGTCDPGPCDRVLSFLLRDSVALYGGFAGGESALVDRNWHTNETVLSGDLLGDDVFTPDETLERGHVYENYDENSLHIVFGDGVDPSAVLDGFTITGGNANTYDDPFHLRYAGGVALVPSGSFTTATIRNCIIEKNVATDCGAGLAAEIGNFEIRNTILRFNQALMNGAVFLGHGGTIRLINSTLSDNRALSGNGGALGAVILVAVNCEFSRNSTLGQFDGGAVKMDSSIAPTIVNCLFNSNRAGRNGGGIQILDESSGTEIVNCTFVANHAVGSGGGIFYSSGDQPALQNCILWDNTAATGSTLDQQITGDTAFDPDAHAFSCDIAGLEKFENGNISADPVFAGAVDFHLSPSSPCRNTGDNDFVVADDNDADDDLVTYEATPDLDLFVRVVGPSVDMGAYEETTCPADLNGDCYINSLDLGILLSAWSDPSSNPGCGGAIPCSSDLNGDGHVTSLDLAILLSAWTGTELCSQLCDPGDSFMAGGSGGGPTMDAELIDWLLGLDIDDLWAWWTETFGGGGDDQ